MSQVGLPVLAVHRAGRWGAPTPGEGTTNRGGGGGSTGKRGGQGVLQGCV